MPAEKKNSEGKCEEFKEKTLIVVFGASGDVARKYTFPSLFALYSDGQLPPGTRIFGYARSDLDDEKFYDQVTGGIEAMTPKGSKVDEEKVKEYKKLCQYVRGAYDEDEAFQNLEKELQKVADKDFGGESNRVYYLALPPSQFTSLAEKVKKNNHTGMDNRLVIEKPFGKDTESSKEMMKSIMSHWKESEIFRIDHFLGEEMMRAFLHLRFGNEALIEGLLNKERVGAVLVELQEEFGCEGRGGYFDEFGMIRDVLQNHLLQMALTIAMDKPKSLDGDGIRDCKLKVLQAMRPADKKDAVFGQYTKGGDKEGYLEDESVENKESKTETFATTVLWIDNEKWKGVPFILKAGKALDKNLNRITIQLKPSEDPLFGKKSDKPTELRIELIPEERVYFVLQTKLPGLEDEQTTTEMTLDYKKAFEKNRVPNAYETVIRAVLKGDQTMFVREDELIASWEVYTPLLHYIEGKESPRPIDYEYGSAGPKETIDLEKRVGFVHSD